jgi:NAD(P)-dependent dehydrogenase (short-subunit alcohol dehydrogenase family)
VAIVTAASKGIGAASARRWAPAGVAVVVNYASGADGAEHVVREIHDAGGRAGAVRADVFHAEEAHGAMDLNALYKRMREVSGYLREDTPALEALVLVSA